MADESGDAKYLSGFGAILFGSYLVILACALGLALVALMRSMPKGAGGAEVPSELDLVLVVIIVGALGSYVHTATSFASYIGNRRLATSWLWWYILRPFIGAALALIFYFVVRAGFLQAGSGPENLSLFGIAGLAGLTGMFSKQATDKLRELFDNLFRVGVKDERADKLSKASEPPTEDDESSESQPTSTASG